MLKSVCTKKLSHLTLTTLRKKQLSIFIISLFVSVFGYAQEDHKVTIENIFFVGNKRTKESLIRRELSFKEGEVKVLSDFRKSIETDRNNVFNLRLFVEVTIGILERDTTSIDVVITMTERWYWIPAPIFQLADRNFNEWWVNRNRDLRRVNYGMRFSHANVRGKGERLQLTLQSGFTRNLFLGYSFPYIDKKQRYGLKVGLGYKDRKNVAYTSEDHIQTFLKAEEKLVSQNRASIEFRYRSGFYTVNEFIVQYRDNHASDTVIGLNPNFLGFENGQPLSRQQYFNLGYVFRVDKRDTKNYPLKGYDFNTLILKRGIGVYNDLDAFFVNSYFGNFTNLGKDFYLSNSVRLLAGGPGDQAYNGYTSLGFGRSLVRGFELFVIEGSDFYLTKNDFKKKIVSTKFSLGDIFPEQLRIVPLSIFVKTFFDAAYVKGFENYVNNDRLTDKWIYSAGLGVDFVTSYDFVLRLEGSYTAENKVKFFVNFKSAL